ncbi:MAG: efflux RND transporter permease subunit [Gemmataceae bacterium]
MTPSYGLATCARPGLSGEGYGIVLAIHGGDDRRNLAATAESFADELRKSGKLSDVGLGPEGRVACPSLLVDVNREKARALGIDIGDVFTTLQVYLGSMYVNDFNRFGRTWQVIVGAEGAERRNIETLKRMTVKNAAGELVPLGAVVVVRDTHGPALVRRFNGAPMITVGANRGPGVLADEARALCEAAARKVLSKGYEMEWLHAP